MCDFSNKYNIRINTTDNIINLISNFNGIICKDNFNISELYFINKTIDITKIENFNDISDYAVITNKRDKKYVKLYNKEVYQAPLEDILSVSELLLMFGYEILFSIIRSIHKYSYNGIEFYVQYINSKTYVLSFGEYVTENYINTILNLFTHELKIDLDNRSYFDVREQEFINLKK